MRHLLCGLAANPALTPEAIDRLIGVADDDIGAALAGRADLSRTQAVALAARVEASAVRLAYEGRLTAADIDPRTRPVVALALLDQGLGPAGWARLFAADPDPERREKLAACPGLPVDVVATLTADRDVRVVVELASWAGPDTAAALADHPHAEVRRAVATNEATPPAVLGALLVGEGLSAPRRCPGCDRGEQRHSRLSSLGCDGTHESAVHDVRVATLRNAATPAEAVAAFVSAVEHPSTALRWALAGRPDLAAQACTRLASDPVPGVRGELAENPAIDDAVIRTLARDHDPEVRRRLAHHPRVPLDVLRELARTSRIGSTLLPRIATAAAAEVDGLAAAPDPVIRMLVAQRRDLPPAVRDRLVGDADAKVAKSIAAHPGLSERQLRALVDRYGVRVHARVAANPDAPAALLEEVARHEPPARKALREVARHPVATAGALLACLADERARPIVAGRPELESSVVVELLDDADWQVVEAAAANPALPGAVVAELLRRM
ncbi:hypothetical protein ACH4E8_15260 [Streptomyces sp. NPDC017979]|uniref:hypothetical protein n=1 Tax=Streptomyces sp. NPDC017979 TaxID=3365024 RepID=UPI00378D14D2